MRMICALALVLLAAAPVAAQPCVGDCNGNGTVGIDELITGVRIALGDAPLASCPVFDANGDGTLGIDELVRGVGAALNGCPATPTIPATPQVTTTVAATHTPEATASPDDTPTPEDTGTPLPPPTATPTVPPVEGDWVEAALTIATSDCEHVLTEFLADELAARGPCDQHVERTGETTVRIRDCSEQEVDATVAPQGTLAFAFPPESQSAGDCTLTLTTSATVPLGSVPAIAAYTFELVFSGTPCPSDCTVTATGEWTRAPAEASAPSR